ncbi:MAG: hypothetical protein ACXWFJ_08390, partial [Candidatus Aminicenantales bacterium]
VFAGYFRKRLPQFGRTAGDTARVGSEKAKELAAQAGDKAGDKWDPSALGKKAGEGVREAREIRDSFKGALDAPASKPAQSEEPAEPVPAQQASDDPPAGDEEPETAREPRA